MRVSFQDSEERIRVRNKESYGGVPQTETDAGLGSERQRERDREREIFFLIKIYECHGISDQRNTLIIIALYC